MQDATTRLVSAVHDVLDVAEASESHTPPLLRLALGDLGEALVAWRRETGQWERRDDDAATSDA